MSSPNLYQEYTDHLRKVSHLENTMNILDVDSLLSLRDNGQNIRAEQLGVLGELVHQLLTSGTYTKLLSDLEQDDLDAIQKKMYKSQWKIS